MTYAMHRENKGVLRLREWMQKQATTQKGLGELLGVHQSTVSTWLLGRTPSLSMALLIRAHTQIPVEAWDEAVEHDHRSKSARRSSQHRKAS